MVTEVWLKRARVERFSTKRSWYVTAWRLVDVAGNDLVQPWFENAKHRAGKAEAVHYAARSGWEIQGELT